MSNPLAPLPVMAHAKEEAADMASIASALVLNIGTLTNELIDSMIIAGKSANSKGIPVILDAVGAGATRFRDIKAAEILNEVRVSVIKGNASEIARLAGENVVTKGVESSKVEGSLIDIAKKLALRQKATVAITGKEDIVTDGKKTYIVKNGHSMMGCVVGTGCMAASVIGAFCAVEKDFALGAAHALSCYGIAGELAAEKSKGPGSFHEHFYDEVHNLNSEKIEKMAKVEEIQ